jgi:hypothetical protein
MQSHEVWKISTADVPDLLENVKSYIENKKKPALVVQGGFLIPLSYEQIDGYELEHVFSLDRN